MKKSSLIIFIVVLLQIIVPFFEVIDNNIFTSISRAEMDYSSIDLNTLEEIKDNSEALSQVNNISVISYNTNENQKILQQLDFIKLCPNIEYIYICVNGLNLDKTFFNNITSSKGISISVQWGSINFEGINNSNITSLYLSENKVYNFSNITNLNNLRELLLDSVDGFSIENLGSFNKLERIELSGQKIENYEDFFEIIKNVKNLGLYSSNLQNSDIKYMKKLHFLEQLNLYGTYVTDINFLKDLQNIKIINLPLNVSDLSILYELPNLQEVSFDGITEMNVDNTLIEYFDSNNIEYPKKFDRNISNKINDIIDNLNFTEETTELDKIEKITEYVLKNMKCNEDEQWEIYNREGYVGKTTLDLDINYGYGVCHDYSILEYTLLKAAGIDAYYVRGYALMSESGNPGSHAWNMVRIDENWYGIDSLWMDDDNGDPTSLENKNFLWKKYFLKNTKIDDLNDWPQYGDSEEYMNKYFALEHRTFNNPQDSITNTIDISTIEITTLPAKKQYIQNYENLDLTGGILTITYNDKTTYTISLTDKNIKTTGFNNANKGTNTITVEYEGKTTTFDIQIVLKQLLRLEIISPPTKKDYYVGETFDSTGMQINAIYNDGSSKEITNYGIVDGDNLTAGKTNVTISYTENGVTKTVEQAITVTEKLNIIINNYNEVTKNNKKYMCNINPNTKFVDIINNTETNGIIKLYKGDNEITEQNTKLATGMKLQIILNDEVYESIIVVKGDINGDGEIDFINDIIRLNNYRLNRINLETEYILAGDLDQNNTIDFINDIIRINNYRLGRIKNL